jgi:hypothetical protein
MAEQQFYLSFRFLDYETNNALQALRAQYEVRLLEIRNAVDRDGWLVTESGSKLPLDEENRLADVVGQLALVLIEMVENLYEMAAKAYFRAVGSSEYKERVDYVEQQLFGYALERWAQLTRGLPVEALGFEQWKANLKGSNQKLLIDTLAASLRSKAVQLELQMWQTEASQKPGDLPTESAQPPATSAPATFRRLASSVSTATADPGTKLLDSQDVGVDTTDRLQAEATGQANADGLKTAEVISDVAPEGRDQLTRMDDSVERINPAKHYGADPAAGPPNKAEETLELPVEKGKNPMSVFVSSRTVTVIRDAGTPAETRWTTQMGGDFVHTGLFHEQVKTGDEIHCELFDEPRVIVRVDPVLMMVGIAHWKATIMPCLEFDRRYRTVKPNVAHGSGPAGREVTEQNGEAQAEVVGAAGDPEMVERSKIRSNWLDQKLAQQKDWTSDTDIEHNGGPAYNTIQRYRSGAVSTRELYVRRQLANAFKCEIAEVPA